MTIGPLTPTPSAAAATGPPGNKASAASSSSSFFLPFLLQGKKGGEGESRERWVGWRGGGRYNANVFITALIGIIKQVREAVGAGLWFFTCSNYIFWRLSAAFCCTGKSVR